MEVRAGSSRDVPSLVDLMFVEPGREAIAMAGSEARARAFQGAFLDHAFASGATVLVADDGAAVGFAHVSDGSDVPPLRTLVPMTVRAMGVGGAVRAAWRSTARLQVDISAPPGGLHLVELQVHPHRRGSGIGGVLLDAVVAHARERGAAHVSLTTGTTNPARRLYERHGFEVVREKRGERYERLTAIPGRVLMVKRLTS